MQARQAFPVAYMALEVDSLAMLADTMIVVILDALVAALVAIVVGGRALLFDIPGVVAEPVLPLGVCRQSPQLSSSWLLRPHSQWRNPSRNLPPTSLS